jgi:hypothetical protein
MMNCVHRYEGTVTRVMGDGIVALFGAPLAQEDHALRACYAALDIQSAMDQIARSARLRDRTPLRVRVGLNSGEVVVKAIGNDLHMDYDAIGLTVHLASRMEQIASPGSVQITAQTLSLAGQFIDVEPMGPIAAKGVSEPVQVYRLRSARTGRSRFSVASARGLTRLIGRDRECATLEGALNRAANSAGQIVAAVGDPGVGKSRLFYEFLHSSRTQGWLTLECGAVSFRRSIPWAPIVELLRSYFAIEDDDDPRQIVDRVSGRIRTLDESLKSAVPALCSVLGVATDDATWNALEPMQRRWRTQQAVKTLLLRESVSQPVVLMFEDLHWADESTLQLIESLVESLSSSRVLLLVNYRPEFEHRWANRSYYTQVRVDPLRRDETDDLLGPC